MTETSPNMPRDLKPTGSRPSQASQPVTVERSAAGYWTVQRDGVQLAFAMTRTAAEREREMLVRLGRASTRRAGSRSAARP